MIINKRQWIHRITAVLLIVMTGMAATVQMTSAAENSSAKKSENTSTSLKEAQQEKAALEKALEKAKQTINELKESKGDVQAKVNDLNTQLMNISSRITALENQLAQKNQELTEKKDQIEDTKDQLEDAKKQEEQQYADMKVRIQFMYENAQESYFEALFDSESFSDFLNSAEYIIQIQEYDRKKLKEYQETVAYIDGVEQQLEEDYATLEEMKKEVEQEKIERMLKAAMAAPSACNQQPWEFYVVTDKKVIAQLSEASPYAHCAKEAPVVFVPCYRSEGIAPEYFNIDMSAAVENLLLEADTLGLGAVWMGISPDVGRMEAVRKVLNIPAGLYALSLIHISEPTRPY